MFTRNPIPRTAGLILGIAGLATAASAHTRPAIFGTPKAIVLDDARPDSIGKGLGSIHLPTATADGLMVGVLVDRKDGTKFTLEATLTTWMPLLGPGTRVAFGGIYGQMREHVEPTVLAVVPDALLGRVEGYWRLERNLTGWYSATVYERVAGAERIAGIVEGPFRVSAEPGAVPGPQPAPLAGRAISKKSAVVLHAAGEGAQEPVEKRPAFAGARPSPVGDAAGGAPASSGTAPFAAAQTGTHSVGSAAQAAKRAEAQAHRAAARLAARKANYVSGMASAFGTSPRFATPPACTQQKLVWPELSGVFRASYELYE